MFVLPKINDWRLRNQEDYLKSEVLIKSKYKKPSEKWDHDHCDFCFEKFSENDGDLHEGYCTKDKRIWICEECYEDFKEDFNFIIESKEK